MRAALEKFVKSRAIEGYDAYLDSASPRRALLSYLVHPLLLPRFLLDPAQFSNQGMAREIPRVLNELGCVVDIIDYTNSTWVPRREYDLFIGHAHFSFARLADLTRHSAQVVYFATGVHWRQQNTAAAKRLYDLAMRRGVLLAPERVSQPAEGEAYSKADAIVCLGNQHTAASFHDHRRVYHLNNAAYPLEKTQTSAKDYEAGRNHFLFFSGLGNVHKGLDLLLEAFAGTSLHLHVCQRLQADFANAYRDELTRAPNIHVHGFVKMRTPEFNRIASQCGWVILPTCAEGQPGSVIECMAYGLVPILPKTASIDLDDFGLEIESLEVGSIQEVTRAACSVSAVELERRAVRSAEVAAQTYSVESFRANLKTAIAEVLSLATSRAR